MRRHVGTVGGIAKLAEPIAEAGRGVGLAEVRHQERLDADRWRRVDDLAQPRMDWNFEVRFLAAFGLALIDGQDFAVDMLPSDLDDIAATLAGIEQKGEGEPCLGANRMPCLKACDVLFRPCFIARVSYLLASDA